MYKVKLVKSAIKDLSKLPPKEALKITEQILLLKDNPRPLGCKNYLEVRMNTELE